jgi:hypothetical protein
MVKKKQNMRPPARTQEIFELLKQCASEMRTVTYGELAEVTGLARRGTGKPLVWIRDEICRARGLPWLNAIVVNKATRRPGDNFLPANTKLAQDDLEQLWRGMVVQVYCFDWAKIDFCNPS